MFYQDINAIIVKIDADLSAAESHGMAVGMLCVNNRTGPGYWLSELLHEGGDFNVEDKAILEDMFGETRSLLASDEFTFELLLPDEDAPLSEQIEALGQWCQGFLFGLGSTSATSDPTANWSDDIREIVKDIAEFTKLDTDAESEDAENDFMEITEYLRAAVIFLYTELNSVDGRTVH
jgi:uncharacterized protein YgfB (UPF0149 family)